MTRYRAVTRTGKYGSIKQHADIDFIYYAQFCLKINGEPHCFSKTTRTLEEAEQWIENNREKQKIDFGWKPRSYKKKITNNFKK